MARVFDCAVFQTNVFQGITVGAGTQSTLDKTVNQAVDTTQTIQQQVDSTKSIKREGV